MTKHTYKPYGFHDDCTGGIKKRCQQCRKRIKKRIDKLDDKNKLDKISRRVTSPIYGEIPIDNIANILIDTCYMQRLKRIGQLSFCDLAFPGANHTRFEHSLGTYYLACKICDNNYFKDEKEPGQKLEKMAFKISALLHDIGHGPFSHMSEILFEILKLGGDDHNHEKRAKNIILNEIGCLKSILVEIFTKVKKFDLDNGLSEDQFLRIIRCNIDGEDPGEILDNMGISLLLNGPVDIDKLDYMVRDAYYSGVPSGGAADVRKICQNIYTKRNKNSNKRNIIIKSKIIPAVFNLFSLRFTAYKSFIYHHVPLIAQEMMLRGLFNYFKNKKPDYVCFYDDDKTIISKLRRKSRNIAKIIFEIENRLLFKRIGCFIPEQESNYKEFQKRRKREEALAKKIGIDKNGILIVFSPQVKFYPKGIENLYIDYTGIKKNKLFSKLFKGTIKDKNGKSCNLKFKSEVMICCRNDKKTIEEVKRFIKEKTKINWTYIKD